MGSDRKWDDDDGRVIADMSGIERPRLFVPRSRRSTAAGSYGASADSDSSALPQQGAKGQNTKERPWESEPEFTPQERRMYMLGALKAALLIALVFIVGLGAAVWLMLLLWT